MLVQKMRDIAEMQKLLDSNMLSYENISKILNLPDVNLGGYVNVNQPNSFYFPPLRFTGANTASVDKLFDNMRSECLVDLFLKDPELVDKLCVPGIENDLEYIALKNVLLNEEKAIAVIDAMMKASPKYDIAVINVLQFAIINGKDNITNHILDNYSGLDSDGVILCRFIRFLVEQSRFDIIKRIIDEDDEQAIRDILSCDFWNDGFHAPENLSNAEAACRYLEEMLGKLFNKKQIKERVNDEINHPYNMQHIISSIQNLDDLAKHGVTISNATLVAAAVWDEITGDFNEELFKYKIKPLLADNLTFSLCELVEYFTQRTCYREFNISVTIIKTIELVGAERLTVLLDDTNYDYTLSELEYLSENSIMSSINGNAVKALLKIPNWQIDPDRGYSFIEKLTVHSPRLIIGLVNNGAITGKVLDAVLDVAINSKNYELINQIRLAIPTK